MPQQLREAYGLWYDRAKVARCLRAEQRKEEYMVEFMNAYQRAKYPLGSIAVPKA